MTPEASAGPVYPRVLEGLDHVENTLFALGSVWAVTSDLPDNYSAGAVNGRLWRIEPSSGDQDLIFEGLDEQPLLAEQGGLVWVKLVDQVVALDEAGVQIHSVPWERAGEIFAGEGVLWITDFRGAQLAAIDPAVGEIVGSVDTVRFPVAPISAFGYVWLPSSTDGDVSIIDEETLGQTTNLRVVASQDRHKDVTAVPGRPSGDEVWVRKLDGQYAAISAADETFGEVSQVEFDRSINLVHPVGDQILLLPLWGTAVFVADKATTEIIAEIPLDAIPFRAVVEGDEAWVTSDGGFEGLFRIDLQAHQVLERLQVGENLSNTTGPTQPFVVNDEVWVPNRGDSKIVIAATSDG
ncbi:MAG: hypothetical protein AAGA65_28665 [Actinomycetota bacterium]